MRTDAVPPRLGCQSAWWEFGERACPRRRRGFTLVELLTVIVIVGTLMALLLPAIQAAREAARQNECKNHLRQAALGMHLHHSLHRAFPSGGWGWRWVGDPDRGTGPRQPGGWVFSLLPFVEQRELFELGKGSRAGDKLDANTRRIRVALAVFHCPSRRTAKSYPMGYLGYPAYNAHEAARVAKTDYAANAGDVAEPWSLEGPETLEEGDRMAAKDQWPDDTANKTGICFLRSAVRDAHVRDGMANTYLMGEKYVQAGSYASGQDWADNESMYSGYNDDTHRSVASAWRPGADDDDVRRGAFGSAHAAVFHMSMCDGSVRPIECGIDPEVHRCLGTRAGGETTSD